MLTRGYLETDPDPIDMVIRVELFIHKPAGQMQICTAWLIMHDYVTGVYCLMGLWMNNSTLLTMMALGFWVGFEIVPPGPLSHVGDPAKHGRKQLQKTEERLILPTLTQLTGQHGGEPSKKLTVQPHRVGKWTLNDNDLNDNELLTRTTPHQDHYKQNKHLSGLIHVWWGIVLVGSCPNTDST